MPQIYDYHIYISREYVTGGNYFTTMWLQFSLDGTGFGNHATVECRARLGRDFVRVPLLVEQWKVPR